jgi:hypothetical protein
LAAALANPTDPLNFGALGRLTKTGSVLEALRAASRAEQIGKTLLRKKTVKGKQIFQFSEPVLKQRIARNENKLKNLEQIAETTRTREQDKLLKTTRRQLKSDKKILEELPTRNQILEDLQIKRGMSQEEMLRVPTLSEQLRSGERSLLGWVSPLSTKNIPFRNLRGFEATARPLVGGRLGAGAVDALAPLGRGVSTETRRAFNAVTRLLRGSRDLRPGALSERGAQALQILEEAALANVGDQEAFFREAQRWIRQFGDLGADEHRKIIDALENRNDVALGNLRRLNELVEQTDYDALQKQMVERVVAVREGNMATGKQLTPESELRFSPSRLSEPEIKSAVAEWDGAGTPALRMPEGHTYRFDQNYITVRLNGNTRVGRMSQERLEEIFHSTSMANIAGLPNYRVVVREGDKFLVARNMPSAGSLHNARIRNSHLENLGNVAAGLGRHKHILSGTGSVGDNPVPILISPFGGVQVLSPEAFLRSDAVPSVALQTSEGLIRQLVRDHVPSIDPDLVNLPMLSTVTAARKVGGGARKYVMEPDPTTQFLELEKEGGIRHVDTQYLIDHAENAGFIRQLMRGQTPDESPIRAFEKANEIDTAREAIRTARQAGKPVRFQPLVYSVSPDGRFLIHDGLSRLAAAGIEDAPTVPIYRKPYLGEVVADSGDYYNSFRLRGYDVLDQSAVAPAANKALDEVAKASAARKARVDAGDEVRSLQSRIGDFAQEKDEILKELGRLAAKEPVDDLEVFANEARLEEIDSEIRRLQGQLDSLPRPDADPGDLLPRLEGILDEDYRMLDQEGNPLGVSLRNIEPSGTASLAAREELVEAFRRMAAVPARGRQRTVDAQWDALRSEMVRAYGNIDGASLRLADFASISENADEFARTLLRDMQEQGSRLQKFPVDFTTRAGQRKFLDLRASADRYLDDLARRGVFTTNSITPGRAAVASKARKATVLFSDVSGENLRITDVNKSTEELQKFSKQHTKHIVDPADVHTRDSIVMESNEQQTAIRFGSLVEGPHPRMFSVGRMPSVLKLSDEEKVKLAGKNIFHINPEGELDELAPYQNALGLVNSETKSMVFFRTRSQDLFVKVGALPKEDSVLTMAEEIMGEAVEALRVQEWGYILDNKVVLNNPIGGMMDTFSNSSLKVLENQLRQMAKQFHGMGFNKEMLFEVFTPFSHDVWTHIYTQFKRKPTIGDAMGKSFRLKLPKELEHLANTSTDIDIARPAGSVRIRRNKLAPGVRELVNWLEKTLNDAMLSDAATGHPVGWKADYFPRLMPRDTRDALEKSYANAIARNPKLKRAVNASDRFKDRKYTSLSTNEIQDLYRLGKTDAREIYKSADSARQADYILSVREMLPDGLEFFYTDPILATIGRRMESFKLESVVTTLDRLESLEDTGFLLRASSKSFRAITNRNKELDSVQRRMRDQQRLIGRMEEQKEALGVSDATRDQFRALEANIEKAEGKLRKLALREDELVAASVNDHVIAGRVPENPGEVWLAGPAARELHMKGLLDETNMLDHPGSDLVRVRFNDDIRRLTEDNALDIYYMTPEGAELMSRLFRIQRNPGPFLRWYDKLLSMWKQITLFPLPQFHIRNSLSDAWLMFLGRAGDFGSMQESWNHLKLLERYSKGKLTKGEAYSTMRATRVSSVATGQEMNMEQLWNAALGQGISKGRFVVNDFVSSVEDAGLMQEMIRVAQKSGIEEASRLARGFRAPGIKIQEARETWQRFGVFISEWKKSGDIQAAGLRVKEIFYDYNNLTSFEKSVLKRLIPFYAWSRFNIPRMIKTIATEPVLHAKTQAFIRNLQFSGDGQPIDERKLPDWAQQMAGLVVGKNPDGTWMVKSLAGLLPVYDLVPAFHQSPLQFGRDALSPLIKVPLEQMVNEVFFSGAPIERVPAERARSGTLAALGATRRAPFGAGALGEAPLSFINFIWNEKNMNDLFRFGKQVTQMVDWVMGTPDFRGDTSPALKAMVLELTIGRTYDIDPRFTALIASRENSSLLRRLERLAIEAERAGNITARNAMTARLNQLRFSQPPRR